MTMKLVTYDLDGATDARREALDEALTGLGFKRILETVWVADTIWSTAYILEKMEMKDGDKAIVADLDTEKPYEERGLRAASKPGEISTREIYARINNRQTGRIKDLLTLLPC
ncbi:hypothetical protein [Mesorhizobium sp. M4B.F.Ca.ET.049.02.1.2]|uniref:hypothetical protein n=1 Tax=Mesorhizobium sp. M4B.F.Ca.ET.049.02.1.2 TaxID=2496752 RepID=UPI000FCCC4B3|nr:hypothetical protein [Mesorhizobium sp. M4B.F.Ca.ET.049.02.1.2]RUW75850.1 hypothetical protein EOA31_08260 [Mesorhizobium sp. M4B.F.Ca.ET.049.02.1.2]TIU90364.1 MAG: hypothetical protein E5W03_00890 [Mesorhizobium sp.]TIV21804.1 MAG: hypothetical protein E5W02_10145 [Mesorhizobium sp.]